MFQVQDVSSQLGDFRLTDITFNICPGEYRILLGPTGTGKTVLLETLAGLYPVQSGQIYLQGKNITHTPPECRNMGIVYQDYALFPHLTVFDNIAFGLKLKKIPRKQKEKTVLEVAGFLRISHLLSRTPAHLSGGEAQRVALARTLVLKPALLLLDEPLSAVDQLTGNHLRKELQRIHTELGQSILHITHNLQEAFLLGDTMTVMQNGKILQNGSPEEIYKRPATRLVAELLGMNNFLATRKNTQGQLAIKGLGAPVFRRIDQELQGKENYLVTFPDWAVDVLPTGPETDYLWQGMTTIKQINTTGNQIVVSLKTPENALIYASYSRREINELGFRLQPGLSIRTGIQKKGVHIIAEKS